MAVRHPLEPSVPSDPLSTAAPQDESSGGERARVEDGRGEEGRAEEILGHVFARPELLREALTHRSAASRRAMVHGRSTHQKGVGSNERLEFVGDRVLGLLMAEWLAERFPDEQEGKLGPRLASLVSQPVLAEIAERLGLAPVLAVAPGESRAGVRRLATVLSDAMEALLGALYLDAGLEEARRFVRHAWEPSMVAQAEPPKDAKTALQEFVLGRGMQLPVYEVISRDGPPHDPTFLIGVSAAGQTGTGSAGNKRAAERLAAAELLEKLSR